MSWVQIERGRGEAYRVWIHWWHPGFWAAAYDLFRHSNGVLVSLRLTALFIYTMSKRKR